MLALLATHRQRTNRRTTSGVIGIINICATLYAHVQDDYDDPSIASALCVCVSFSCSGTFRRPLPVGLLHVRATLLLQKNSFCCCCYCLAPIFALYDHIGAAGSEGISFANPFTHAHNRPHTPHALSSRVFFRVGQKKDPNEDDHNDDDDDDDPSASRNSLDVISLFLRESVGIKTGIAFTASSILPPVLSSPLSPFSLCVMTLSSVTPLTSSAWI